MKLLLRVGLACLPCAQALATPPAGLLLEPARQQSAPLLAVAEGCVGIRLLPPAAIDGTSTTQGAGLRVEPARGADALLSIPGKLAKQIDAAAAAYGHEASLMKAIVRVESAFNPAAVSSKGALGLMQIIPATATGLGVADPRRQLLDPEINLRTGARHLRVLRDKFSDRLDLVLAAYNAGEGAVTRWKGVPPYAETRAYVQVVLTWQGRYQNGRRVDSAAAHRPSGSCGMSGRR
jgi:Transglycosylase SLT domain